jgi:lipid-binding SYLF domain-containing protein
MKARRFLIASLVCLIALGAIAADDEQKKEEERTEIRQMAQDTLTRLYKAEPSAQAAIHKAYGYAVFSNTGIKILVGGSGRGEGLAVSNKTKAETFMKMLQIQAGLGFGVKKFRVVFVFVHQ